MPDGAVATLKAPAQRFKPYPAYKDSGVEWLGEVPAHWEVRRLKTFANVQLSNIDKKSVEGENPIRLCNYVHVYYSERITGELDFMPATATPEQVRRFSLRLGDVLVTKDSESWTDIAVPAVVAEELPGVVCGYHLAHIRPEEECDGAFLARLFSAIGPRDQFRVAANGITRFGLSGDAIRTGLFALPPLGEQCAIAAFLEEETTRIDALVAKKERLIELLEEKRTALITHAVTRGLDPNVPMKDSGVEWLGEIPAHWRVNRLRNVVTAIEQGWSPLCENRQVESDEWGVLKAGCVNGEQFDESEHKALPANVEPLVEYEVRVGDVLVSRANTRQLLGSAVLVDEVHRRLLLCDKLYRIRVNSERVLSEFMVRALASPSARFQLEREATGASGSMQNIAQETISNLFCVLPPLDDQYIVVSFLNREVARIDDLVKEIRTAIDRLKELRTALVSAAVTGKIDVREDAT